MTSPLENQTCFNEPKNKKEIVFKNYYFNTNFIKVNEKLSLCFMVTMNPLHFIKF